MHTFLQLFNGDIQSKMVSFPKNKIADMRTQFNLSFIWWIVVF